MRTQPVDKLEVDAGIVVTAAMSAAVGFLGWVIRVAARETLAGLKASIDAHTRAIDSLSLELREMREEVSDVKARLTVVEHDRRPR